MVRQSLEEENWLQPRQVLQEATEEKKKTTGTLRSLYLEKKVLAEMKEKLDKNVRVRTATTVHTVTNRTCPQSCSKRQR